jgi:hypothetical protein
MQNQKCMYNFDIYGAQFLFDSPIYNGSISRVIRLPYVNLVVMEMVEDQAQN